MTTYFNTALGISMLPDGNVEIETLSPEKAIEILKGEFENVANPSHGNTLNALTRMTGVDCSSAKGGRVYLGSGDRCLVAQIQGLPRETREFSDEEVANATFSMRLVTVR